MAGEPHLPSTTRLVNFSDAVVAIAATLLILPLVERAGELGEEPLDDFLSDNSGALLAFLLSFVVILRFWYVHHRVFKTIEDVTWGAFWANAIWLLSIVFLPFPTEIIGGTGADGPLANGIYIGTMLVTTLAALVLADVAMISRVPYVSTALLMAIALVVAVAVPAIGLFALLLLLLSPVTDILLAKVGSRSD